MDDFWDTALCGGVIELVSGRENHGDATRAGYMNGILLPPGGLGFRCTVLMIVQ